jgi:hypothetical protein
VAVFPVAGWKKSDVEAPRGTTSVRIHAKDEFAHGHITKSNVLT